jgi:hypothetical protein
MLAPIAHADGDPASDYLLSSSVFLPPDVVVPDGDAKQLNADVASAKRRGYEIRVAVIGTRYDLGSVGALFRQPRRYALFLGQELRFVYQGRLLVVMPNGYGVSQTGKEWPTAQSVVGRLRPAGAGGRALALAAVTGVRSLAAASGVALPRATAHGSSGGNLDRVAALLVALAVLGGGTVAFALRGGKRKAG